MDLIKVKSSNLQAVGYDKSTKTLRILFSEGATYDYRAVPVSVYKALMAAESKGSFFQHHVVGQFEYEKSNLREEGHYGKEQSTAPSRSSRKSQTTTNH